MKQEIETITGVVEAIIFRNDDTGFTVLELSFSGELITVVGELIDVDEGEELELFGTFTSHPTYGQQFKVSAYERRLPASASAIFKYLSGGALKGVGPATARKLVDFFGDATLEVIEKRPEELTKVKGITQKKADAIAAEFTKIFGVRTVMMYLSQFGLSPAMSVQVFKKWGALSKEVIELNPYELCCEEVGLPFLEADEIALKLDFEANDQHRVRNGLIHVLRHNLGNGHTCLPRGVLLDMCVNLLEIGRDDIERVLDDQLADESLFELPAGKKKFIYLPHLLRAEQYIASRIKLMEHFDHPMQGVDRKIAELETHSDMQYAQLQKEAIKKALVNPVFILTGGPGTGKTTTLNAMIELLENDKRKVALAAPTGRAAKRMSELTGRDAKTLHRLLEVDFKQEGLGKFLRNEKNPLPFDVIIVDELSMVDTLLFESLLRAMKMSCQLILVGDSDQLPSVGAGNILKDLIDSGALPVVQLKEVFRQAAKSLIVTNAHRIVQGQLPDLSVRDNDFFFMKSTSYGYSAQTVVDLCRRRLPERYGFSPLWDIQVLCPSRIGALGTGELNGQLQEALNPKTPEKRQVKRMGSTFREGDKVMQIRNNYDIVWHKEDGEYGTGVFNGDIGVIELIDRPSASMLIRYDDRTAEYSFDMLGEIELAYAITVHKSQGSEFDAVIIPLMWHKSRLHFRNLLYTAVTRAKKMLIILGDASTVQAFVENDRKTLRYTNLKTLIRMEESGHETESGV
ncbi:ATP-dependent RecD-like DNA helicase [Candidatus Soleaferrea massiliensis]|uniref:SF1B family DNA helicase RecD2 n=1 Tax=Candidatus Soleaferrea massiliensis TaxID=1470354 RepID=UPI00058EFC30|nr:ATP-dependent RecD-like DNA helicase [Candidatus Soleaferrea massiliensis]